MSLDRYLTARGFQGLESPDLVFAYPRYLTSIRSYYRTTIQRREHRQLDHRALDATWLSIIQSYVPSDYCEVLVVEVTNELPDRRTTQTKTVQWHDAHATHTIEDMISQAGRNQILVRLTQKGWVSLTLSTCQATLPTVGLTATYLALTDRVPAFMAGILGVLVAVLVLYLKAVS